VLDPPIVRRWHDLNGCEIRRRACARSDRDAQESDEDRGEPVARAI
jgi:hypothetical protein